MHRAKQTILKMISGVGNDTQYTCGWRRFARIASDPAAATWYHPSTEEAKAKPPRLGIRRSTVKRLKLDPPGEPVSASASAYAPCQLPPIMTPPPIMTHPLMAHPVCVCARPHDYSAPHSAPVGNASIARSRGCQGSDSPKVEAEGGPSPGCQGSESPKVEAEGSPSPSPKVCSKGQRGREEDTPGLMPQHC